MFAILILLLVSTTIVQPLLTSWNISNWNTSNWNTSNWNTSNWNTSNWNTSNWNTSNWNTSTLSNISSPSHSDKIKNQTNNTLNALQIANGKYDNILPVYRFRNIEMFSNLGRATISEIIASTIMTGFRIEFTDTKTILVPVTQVVSKENHTPIRKQTRNSYFVEIQMKDIQTNAEFTPYFPITSCLSSEFGSGGSISTAPYTLTYGAGPSFSMSGNLKFTEIPLSRYILQQPVNVQLPFDITLGISSDYGMYGSKSFVDTQTCSAKAGRYSQMFARWPIMSVDGLQYRAASFGLLQGFQYGDEWRVLDQFNMMPKNMKPNFLCSSISSRLMCNDGDLENSYNTMPGGLRLVFDKL